MKKTIIILVAILSVCCEPEYTEPYTTFVLPKGKHQRASLPSSLQNEVLSFVAIFDESAMYESQKTENQHDINKLLGFSDCNSFHHDNSARFGWRWLDGKLEIHAYTYMQGIRYSEYIGTVKLNTPYQYQLRITKSSYLFYLQGSGPVTMERKPPCEKGLYYMLYPYFGGDEVAPHDIFIQILFQY